MIQFSLKNGASLFLDTTDGLWNEWSEHCDQGIKEDGVLGVLIDVFQGEKITYKSNSGMITESRILKINKIQKI